METWLGPCLVYQILRHFFKLCHKPYSVKKKHPYTFSLGISKQKKKSLDSVVGIGTGYGLEFESL
jgi:hypothetical protein